MFALRMASLVAEAPRRGAGPSETPPLNLPIGVRAAPATTTLVLGIASGEKASVDKSMVSELVDGVKLLFGERRSEVDTRGDGLGLMGHQAVARSDVSNGSIRLARRSRSARGPLSIPSRGRRGSPGLHGGAPRMQRDSPSRVGRRDSPEAGPARLLGTSGEVVSAQVRGHELATSRSRRPWTYGARSAGPPSSRPDAAGLRRVRRTVRSHRWRAPLLFRGQHSSDDDSPRSRPGSPGGALARLARRPAARRRRLGLFRPAEGDTRLLGGPRGVRGDRAAEMDPQVEGRGRSRRRVLSRAQAAPGGPLPIRALGTPPLSGPLLLRRTRRARDARPSRLRGRSADETRTGPPEGEDAPRPEMGVGRCPPGLGSRGELRKSAIRPDVRSRTGPRAEQVDHPARPRSPRGRIAAPVWTKARLGLRSEKTWCWPCRFPRDFPGRVYLRDAH